MGNFQLAGETKINGMGLLHDIRQQWGLLGTRQKKLNANEMNRKKVMAFLKKCTCTYFKVRRGTNGLSIAYYLRIFFRIGLITTGLQIFCFLSFFK